MLSGVNRRRWFTRITRTGIYPSTTADALKVWRTGKHSREICYRVFSTHSKAMGSNNLQELFGRGGVRPALDIITYYIEHFRCRVLRQHLFPFFRVLAPFNFRRFLIVSYFYAICCKQAFHSPQSPLPSLHLSQFFLQLFTLCCERFNDSRIYHCKSPQFDTYL